MKLPLLRRAVISRFGQSAGTDLNAIRLFINGLVAVAFHSRRAGVLRGRRQRSVGSATGRQEVDRFLAIRRLGGREAMRDVFLGTAAGNGVALARLIVVERDPHGSRSDASPPATVASNRAGVSCGRRSGVCGSPGLRVGGRVRGRCRAFRRCAGGRGGRRPRSRSGSA